MYKFMSIAYITIIMGFMVVYITAFVLNLIRAKKVNKEMKKSCRSVKGKIVEIVKEKKRVFIRVEYTSPSNYTKFVDYFDLTEKEFNDQYYVDQEVEIYYPEIENWKRVTCFPTYLEGQPIKVEKGPLVTDAMFAIVGMMMAGWVLSTAILLKVNLGTTLFNDANFSNSNMSSCTQSNPIMYLLPILLYVFTIPYIIERFTMADRDQNQSYLKMYGVKCMAEVKTFKLGRTKNQKGVKESIMEIEFYNNKGEKIKANLNSFMYTETQEQYVNILYDVHHPKNVVYMRK